MEKLFTQKVLITVQIIATLLGMFWIGIQIYNFYSDKKKANQSLTSIHTQ